MARTITLVLILLGVLGMIGGIACCFEFLSYPTPAENDTPVVSAKMSAGPAFKIPPLAAADRCRAIVTFSWRTNQYETGGESMGMRPFYVITLRLVVTDASQKVLDDDSFAMNWDNSKVPMPDGQSSKMGSDGGGNNFYYGQGLYRTKSFPVPAGSELTATISSPDGTDDGASGMEVQIVRGAVDEAYYDNLRLSGPTYGLAIAGGGLLLLLLAGLVKKLA